MKRLMHSSNKTPPSAAIMLRRALTRISLALILHGTVSSSFLAPIAPTNVLTLRQDYSARSSRTRTPPTATATTTRTIPVSSSPTALSVWWFGGTDAAETGVTGDDDSCELVAVRIERPTSNSRKIYGEIVAPVPLKDVWAILTDYDRLNIHVPNLVESKIMNRPNNFMNGGNVGGEQGDGTFRCRLFQKGAQKIIGFEFGASVTMDMQEIINSKPSSSFSTDDNLGMPNAGALTGHERMIQFKCYDSFFFKTFDGLWTVTERIGEDGQIESLLSYIVDVRPKGPVPVAALEWRIREDVPTNLRAVKKAAVEVGQRGVLQARGVNTGMTTTSFAKRSSDQIKTALNSINQQQPQQQTAKRRLAKVKVLWEESETMAAYLKN